MALAALGALAYFGVAMGTDAPKLESALGLLGWTGCIAVLALSVANYLLRFLRWQYYIRRLGHRLPFARHLLVYLSGFALTVSPGKGGEAVRSIYMREHGVSYAESIAALFVERLLDFLAMVLLSALIVAGARGYAPFVLAALVCVLGVLVLLGRDAVPNWMSARSLSHGGGVGRVARALAALARLLRSSHSLLQPGPVFIGLVLALAAWGAEGLGFYLLLQGLQLTPGAASATGIYAVSALVGAAAFFMPGGIGGMEVVMTSLLVAGGAALATAVIATLLCRLATLWFAVIIGIIATFIVEAWPASPPDAISA
jgi:uncharacterized protein (TIRG00374 family)